MPGQTTCHVLLALCVTVSLQVITYGTKDVAGLLPPRTTSSAMKTMMSGLAEPPFQASQNIAEIMEFVHGFSVEQRTLQVLDFYAGDANFARRARHRGHVAQTFDILHSPSENVFTRQGYFIGLGLCCSLEVFGLGLFGPQCSLWLTYMSQPIHRRRAFGVHGNFLEDQLTFLANVMNENTATYLVILYCRHVAFALEQPGSTYYMKYDSTKYIIDMLGLDEYHTWMKCFSHWMPKPSRLIGTMMGLAGIVRVYSKKRAEKMRRKIKKKLKRMNLRFPRPMAIRCYSKRLKRNNNKDSWKNTAKSDGTGHWVSAGRNLKHSGG
jgi:hypothetical protein